nr:unnamed protein product [Spirometra erinaceieuropaei]
MGLFGYMRINNSGIHRSIDTPCTFTNFFASSPINFSSTSPPTTGNRLNISHLYTPTWSVTCESIAQRLANQCQEHQPTPTVLASTAHTALAPSRLEHRHAPNAIASLAWTALAYSATAQTSSVKYVFVKTTDKSPQA